MNKSILFLFAIILFASSCESINDFRTVASIKSQLEGTWKMVPIPRTSPAETWVFTGGSIRRIVYNTSGGIVLQENGTYSVKTTFATPYVIIDNINGGSYLVAKWTIITLDNKFLTMTQNGNGSTLGQALLQKEFVKQ